MKARSPRRKRMGTSPRRFSRLQDDGNDGDADEGGEGPKGTNAVPRAASRAAKLKTKVIDEESTEVVEANDAATDPSTDLVKLKSTALCFDKVGRALVLVGICLFVLFGRGSGNERHLVNETARTQSGQRVSEQQLPQPSPSPSPVAKQSGPLLCKPSGEIRSDDADHPCCDQQCLEPVSWERHPNLNCSTGHGADVELTNGEPVPNVQHCMRRCEQDPRCDGFIFGEDEGVCYSRGGMDVGKCDADGWFDAYVISALPNATPGAGARSVSVCRPECPSPPSPSSPTPAPPPPPPPSPPARNGLFCFLVLVPDEQRLLADLLASNDGGHPVMGCDDWRIYSNVSFLAGLSDHPRCNEGACVEKAVDGPIKVGRGGPWNSALNTPILQQVWRHLFASRVHSSWAWTVKTELDVVFRAGRLRRYLLAFPSMDALVGAQYRGDWWWIHGPLQVVNWGAALRLGEGGEFQRCVQAYSPGDPGVRDNGYDGHHSLNSRIEDMFFMGCMDHLGISKVRMDHLFKDYYRVGDVGACDSSAVAFHPFKDVSRWRTCSRGLRASSEQRFARTLANDLADNG